MTPRQMLTSPILKETNKLNLQNTTNLYMSCTQNLEGWVLENLRVPGCPDVNKEQTPSPPSVSHFSLQLLWRFLGLAVLCLEVHEALNSSCPKGLSLRIGAPLKGFQGSLQGITRQDREHMAVSTHWRVLVVAIPTFLGSTFLGHQIFEEFPYPQAAWAKWGWAPRDGY